MKAINKNMEEELIATRKSYGEALLELGRENRKYSSIRCRLIKQQQKQVYLQKNFQKDFLTWE